MGALLGAYFKKTGEFLATKKHFEEILRQTGESTELVAKIKADVARSQLEANTTLVETIKADIAKSQLQTSTEIVEAVRSEFAQRDWASRERATLRRVKIEELLRKVNECRAYLERYQQAAVDGKKLDELNPITELRAIAKLYLPELAAETKAFSDMYEDQLHQGLSHRHKLSRLSTDEKQRELKMDYGWQVAKSKKSGEADALIEAWNAVQELICRPQSSDSCPPSFGPVSALRRIPQLGQPTWLDDMPPRRTA
jgi:hypothetical protein